MDHQTQYGGRVWNTQRWESDFWNPSLPILFPKIPNDSLEIVTKSRKITNTFSGFSLLHFICGQMHEDRFEVGNEVNKLVRKFKNTIWRKKELMKKMKYATLKSWFLNPPPFPLSFRKYITLPLTLLLKVGKLWIYPHYSLPFFLFWAFYFIFFFFYS